MIDSAVREGMIDAGRYTPEEIVRDIGGERTVLDSLSTIIFRNGIEKTVGFLNSCSEKIRESEGNMLLIMYEGIHDAYEEILVKRNCDTIFTLSQSPHGNEVERFLQVNKIDGLNVPKRTYPYNILDKGIELSTTGRVV